MSENLDLVRSLYRDHFERGEFFGPAEWAHPEIECVLVDGPAPDSGIGLAGMARVWKGLLAAYEDFSAYVEEYREIDARRILVLLQFIQNRDVQREARPGIDEVQLHAQARELRRRARSGQTSLHLCVALPVSPVADCTVPINFETAIGSFVAPVQLPTSGKLTQQAPVTAPAAFPGGAPTPGQSAFSVAFTKKGTASGYVELSLQITAGSQTVPCATGKIPFTAKLG
jgi:hypothetical protein